MDDLKNMDLATLRRKANQAWESYGLAHQDGDTEDAKRWITKAREYDAEIKSRSVTKPKPTELEKSLAHTLKDTYEMLEWVLKTQTNGPIKPHPFGLAVIEVKQNARATLTAYKAYTGEEP